MAKAVSLPTAARSVRERRLHARPWIRPFLTISGSGCACCKADRRLKRRSDSGDHIGKRNHREIILSHERRPQGLSRRIGGKFIGKPHRQVRGYRHAAPRECCRDGLRQRVHVQRFSIQHDPEIEVVLDPAVGHAKQGNGVQFFRDDGVDRVGPQAGCGKVLKQYGVVRGGVIFT